MKKTIPWILLVLATLACNAGISDIFGGGTDEDFYSEVEYSRSLTATIFALETAIVEATQTAVAATEEVGSSGDGGVQPAETEDAQPDPDQFCAIYEAYVADLYARVDEYERVISTGGDGDPLALAADQAMEIYYDRMVPFAPDEIRPQVEALAEMSLIGLLSSQQEFPEAEVLFEEIDAYAEQNCATSLNTYGE